MLIYIGHILSQRTAQLSTAHRSSSSRHNVSANNFHTRHQLCKWLPGHGLDKWFGRWNSHKTRVLQVNLINVWYTNFRFQFSRIIVTFKMIVEFYVDMISNEYLRVTVDHEYLAMAQKLMKIMMLIFIDIRMPGFWLWHCGRWLVVFCADNEARLHKNDQLATAMGQPFEDMFSMVIICPFDW